jgi:DNA-directed RNA polymerase subunit RPC12/RpoP
MGMTSLAQQRNELKSKLSRSRVVLEEGTFRPLCAYCGHAIMGKPDMNEVLITRGDIQGSKEALSPMIMIKENCVLVHHGDCHTKAHTKDGQVNCIKQLIIYEGFDVINDWLLEMRNQMITSTPCDARRLLKEVYYDPKNVWNLRPSAE